MLAIIRAIERRRIKGASVGVVISDKADAKALTTAKAHGIEALWLDPSKYPTRVDYDRQLLAALLERGVDTKKGLVLLAGFMRLLSPEFVDAFPGRIMNIHPALLPAFPGLKAQEQAIEHGVKVSGCTVHFVVPEVDSGPIIIQRVVRVEPGDDAEALAARILKQEHSAYPEAVRLFVERRLKIVAGRVEIARR